MKDNRENENKELKVPDFTKEPRNEDKKIENGKEQEFVKIPKFTSSPKPWDKYLEDDNGEDNGEIDFDDSEEMESYLSESIAQVTDDEEEEFDDDWEEERPRMSKKKKIVMGISMALGLILLLLLGAGALLANQLKDRDTQYAQSDLSEEELAAQATLAPRPSAQLELDEKVINILLIGEEAINDSGRGRSDSMIIVSMNTEQKTLKMVSIMRDCYVSIPGYRDNKLNAAYNNGGGQLVMDTIEQNFGIKLDGYIRVNFDAFESVINKVGGVEVTLTENEAQYLNSTNYISEKKNRCVKAGTQTLNGNQALGYCRVRYRTANNGEADDFGRTYRQRAVLNAIFEKVKNINIVDGVSMAKDLFGYVQTNMSEKDLLNYATAALSIGAKEVQSMRVPLDHAWTSGKRYCGSLLGDVLLLDFTTNNKALQEFIYGTALGEVMTILPSDNYEVQTKTSAPSTITYAPASTTTATKKPVVTLAPTHPQTPVITENPVKTEAPVVKTEAPVVKTEAPVVKTEAPAKTTAPAKTEAPAPVMTDTPSDVIEPVGAE